jgi:hypothetical protein
MQTAQLGLERLSYLIMELSSSLLADRCANVAATLEARFCALMEKGTTMALEWIQEQITTETDSVVIVRAMVRKEMDLSPPSPLVAEVKSFWRRSYREFI